ncbi:MAG: hypothetical protein GEU80_09615 [Dehalococcoidia bacterium]|nr:hypothetical protein [Dehalococcoidia bacterium]
MSVLVQREFSVAQPNQAEFERQSREGLWPTFLHFGALMVAFGRWGFNGPGGVVVTNTVYADMEHWLATRASAGDFYRDETIMEETKELRPIFEARGGLVTESSARIIDLDDDVSEPRPFYRQAGQPTATPPNTFGAGSVISERRYVVPEKSQEEFLRLSREQIWPWLTEQGGRLVGFGRDPLGPPSQIMTLFAFRSLPDWYRLAHPAEHEAPGRPSEAWQARHNLIATQQGRLLIIGSDFGTKV